MQKDRNIKYKRDIKIIELNNGWVVAFGLEREVSGFETMPGLLWIQLYMLRLPPVMLRIDGK